MQLCQVEHLMNTFSTYLSSKLDYLSPMFWLHSVESNFDDQYVEKVFNKCSTWQSCIFPKFTSFKIGTLKEFHNLFWGDKKMIFGSKKIIYLIFFDSFKVRSF